MALGDAMSFIFGEGQQYRTPQELAKARAVVNAMLADQRAPQNVGEGLNAIGDALLYRSLAKRADASEKSGLASAGAAMQGLFPEFPAAPNGPDPSKISAALDGKKPDNPNVGSTIDFARAAANAPVADQGGDVASYIRQAAAARGIDPDIALRVAQGEGGLKNPFRHGEGPAPRSQLASFGAKENSFGPFQLYISGNNAGLGDRALAAGIDPRKDWKRGVDFALDEVSNKGWGQWYGAKAAGITGMMGVGKRPAAADAVNAFAGGQQVASLDPSIGMVAPAAPSAINPQQAGQPVSSDPKTQRILGAMMNPQPMGGAPLPMQGMQQPQQVAQAAPQGTDLDKLSVMAGGNAGVYTPGQGPSLQQLMSAYSNPWLNDGQRQMIGMMLKQKLDPTADLDRRYKEAQIAHLTSDRPSASSSFGSLDAQARAAGLSPGTPEYQNFMLNGGGAPATFRALDMQAKAAGFQPGTPEYNNFMATRGAGLSAGAAQAAKNKADISTGGDAARVKASGTAEGKGEGERISEARGALPGARVTAGMVADQIKSIEQDPYLPNMLGPVNSRLPNVTEDAARVQAKLDQLQGGAFLQARQLLKGGGAITDFEGKKAEQAFLRMNTAQSVKDFNAALDDFNDAVQQGVRKLQIQIDPDETSPPPAAEPSVDDLLKKYGG